MLDNHTHSSNAANHGIESIAHGVIELQQLLPEYGTSQRRLSVRKIRGQHYHEGYHDFQISHSGMEVFPRLKPLPRDEEFQPTEPVSSGIAELDNLLGGGLESGTNTLLVGPPGSGKSSLAVQFAYAANKRNQRAAILLFDESPSMLLARSAGLGFDLKPLVDSDQLRLIEIDPAETSPGGFANLLQKLATAEDPFRVLVIDSINGYLQSVAGERTLTLQLHEMLRYLGQQGTLTFLILAQQTLGRGQFESPFHTSYLSDTVFMFSYFHQHGELHKAFSILKKRSGVHDRRTHELLLTPKGLRIGKALKPESNAGLLPSLT